MPYAILRVKKLKTQGAILAVGQHNGRERETRNANPNVENKDLISQNRSARAVGDAPSKEVDQDQIDRLNPDLWSRVENRINEVNARIRKNGVLACEVFMGASPEYFRPNGGDAGTWHEGQVNDWTPVALAWLRKEWGEKNVVSAVLHLDETTPHIHAVVVPIDPTSGRLNAARWLNGRKALSDMQDRYGEAMEPLGLQRGIKGSTAEHTSIRDWYGHLQRPLASVPIPEVQIPGSMVLLPKAKENFSRLETARIQTEQKPVIQALETKARAHHLAIIQKREADATNHRLANELKAERSERARREEDLKRQVAKLQQENGRLRSTLDCLRDIPLAEAQQWYDPEELTEAGVYIGQDREGRDRIYGQDGKVVGRNAIDLTMAVHGCKSAGEAAAWIEVRQGQYVAQGALFSHSNLSALQNEYQPHKDSVRDPNRGLRLERFQRARQQVERRQPDWPAVEGIFHRMHFKISRSWSSAGATYKLIDTLFNANIIDFNPPILKDKTDANNNVFWNWLRELESREIKCVRSKSPVIARHGPRR